MDSSVTSVCLSAVPLAMTTLPVLSFSSPAKMSKLPAIILARMASAFLRAPSVTIEP